MSKDMVPEMVRMRRAGCTYEEIGKAIGVSRQCVHAEISGIVGKVRIIKRSALGDCIYPNLKQWLIENSITMIKLSRMIGLKSNNTEHVRRRLCGEIDFTISEIMALLKASGQTFEHMFSVEQEEQKNE